MFVPGAERASGRGDVTLWAEGGVTVSPQGGGEINLKARVP